MLPRQHRTPFNPKRAFPTSQLSPLQSSKVGKKSARGKERKKCLLKPRQIEPKTLPLIRQRPGFPGQTRKKQFLLRQIKHGEWPGESTRLRSVGRSLPHGRLAFFMQKHSPWSARRASAAPRHTKEGICRLRHPFTLEQRLAAPLTMARPCHAWLKPSSNPGAVARGCPEDVVKVTFVYSRRCRRATQSSVHPRQTPCILEEGRSLAAGQNDHCGTCRKWTRVRRWLD